MAQDDPASDTPLSEAARAVAVDIADWCEAQRRSTETLAGKQIRVVWLLLLGGLVLLLILPRLLQEIDFAWQKDSLPPEILKSFGQTESTIERNRREMEAEKAAAEAQVAEIEDEIATETDAALALEDEIRALLDQPQAVWREIEVPLEAERYTILDLSQVGEAEILAAGSGDLAVGTPEGKQEVKRAGFLLQNTTGSKWRSLIPEIGRKYVERLWTVSGGRASLYLIGVGPLRPAGIYGSDDLASWERLKPRDQALLPQVLDITQLADASFLGVGATLARPHQQALFRSDTGRIWRDVLASGGPSTLTGSLTKVVATGNGAIAAGWLDTQEDDEILSFLHSEDGRVWRRETPERDGAPVRGRVVALADWGGRVVAATGGADGQMLAFGGPERGWEPLGPVPYEVTALVGTPDGLLLLFSKAFDRRGDRVELLLMGAEPPVALALEAGGRLVPGPVQAALALGDGQVLAGGENLLVESLTEAERAGFVAQVLDGAAIPEGNVVATPGGQLQAQTGHTAALVRSLSEARAGLDALRATLGARQDVLAAATQTLDRQETVKADFAKLSTELETALRTAEPARQLAQIATRLAVIGLLIYLVQIVVNRYRYLQRLSGFCQARAQAFRLLAAAPDAALLKGVSLGEVTAMLSPDGIGFDKTADPPTGQIVSLLQGGLRRG